MNTTEFDKKIEKARKRLAALLKEKDDLLRGTLLICGECTTAHRISNLTYIQTHWYEEPHGCTGGDSWHEGEGQWDCPTCNQRMRLYRLPQVEALKHLFKGVRYEYKG